MLVVSKDGEAIQTLNLGNNSSQLLFFFNLSTVVKFDNKNIPCVFDDERYEKLPSAILKII